MNKGDYILWLPSWYPNKFEPANGDFVQRHAQAVALYAKIIVCHFPQIGPYQKIDGLTDKVVVSDKLIEYINYVPFKPTPFKLINNVLYNFCYYTYAINCLENIIEQHGIPKMVHVHIPMKAGILATWIKVKYKVPYIVSEHSSHYSRRSPRHFLKRSWVHRLQVKAVIKKAARITNVSKTVGNQLKQIFHIEDPIVIHNVVDTELFYYSNSNQFNSRFTYIHVSGMNEQKNIDAILRVFSLYKRKDPRWTLILVGPVTEELVKNISHLGLETHVELAGEVSYNKVSEFMKRSDAMVMFSRYENFPCVIIEALCCGLPVISSCVDGVPEAVDEDNGILVDPDNETELLQAIETIHKDISFYNRERIAAIAKLKYNYMQIGYQFFNLYSHILSGNG
jgi:glycosyltransferase involved in cell wall biosynthesis